MLSAFAVFALPLLALAQSTQVDIVYNDITDIDTHVLELTSTTAAYQGGLVGQLPIGVDFTPVHLATRKGFYDSLPLPAQISTSDAQRLIDHVNATLSKDNPKAVQVLKSKKPLFDASGSSPVIKSGLELLLFDHLSFSSEVAKRIPPALKADGQIVIDVITVALQDGINYFSS
ncbi:hypothetical protein HII31_10586 [Pseudocercospora fuligena]|uniref:Uncharacterized protein n=1 Tax=Pseudocercospora fuligena TaxID=685502 RepID=A0A8H6VF08_9PEZI|nr:hypothetical protein HII31_10586 [Pseudocercospora fuligena]